MNNTAVIVCEYVMNRTEPEWLTAEIVFMRMCGLGTSSVAG